jgi:NAD(P)-dependent dehydrogenase (short-subunit alcohol dehydrogenase family)
LRQGRAGRRGRGWGDVIVHDEAPGPKVWLITGCSTGIGRAIAEAVIAAGDRVVVTARRRHLLEDLEALAPERVLVQVIDVADQQSVAEAVDATMARFGQLDVVVNNAGVGHVGAVEESDPAEVQRVFGTNVFGTLNVMRSVLPVLRKQRAGHIMFVSSIGVYAGAPSMSIYAATKAALDKIAESLSLEVAPLGIKVSTVLPGLVKTPFRYDGIAHAHSVIDDYDATVGAVRRGLEEPFPETAGDPADVADLILRIVAHDGPAPLRVAAGADALAMARQRLTTILREIEAWESFSVEGGGQVGSLAMYGGAEAPA